MKLQIILNFLFINLVFGVSEAEYRTFLKYAELCSVAYCLKKGLAPGLISNSCNLEICQRSNITIIETFDFKEFGEVGSGFIGLDDVEGEILLIFRGTSSRRDWINNFETIPVRYGPLYGSKCKGCRVHKGFYNFVKWKCAHILFVIHELKMKYPQYQVVVSGHSLGGALALLGGIELLLLGDDPLVVTYGSPRVGNPSFARWVDRNFQTKKVMEKVQTSGCIRNGYFRLTHEGDPVPSLPLPPIFRHAGSQYHIKKVSGEITNCDIEYKSAAYKLDLEFQSSPSKIWPDAIGKTEHMNYLIRITGCNGDSEI